MKQIRAAVFSITTAAVALCLLGLVWAFVARERSTRRLYAEYEVYRVLTSLTDMLREPDMVLPPDERLFGFGLYRFDGTRVYEYGRTPERLSAELLRDPASASRFTETSFILIRPFGMDPQRRPLSPGRPDRPGMGSGPGMMMSMGGSARYAYIEYGLGFILRDQRLLLAGAFVITAALTGAYVLLLHLYRRNLSLREREYQTRELVQLGEAARTLAHEIKNPLGIIRVQSALLRRTYGRDSEDGFRIIDDEVRRLGSLVDRIREFLRSGEGKPERLELSNFLSSWALRYGGMVRVENSVPPGATVFVDGERLANILDNLTRNAQESMEGFSEPGIVEISAAQRRGMAYVSVADRGRGVDPSEAHRLFEPFYTNKEKGSGIGLALSSKWAQAAGGRIAYRPREGGGSLFELRLPIEDRL